MKAPLAFGAAKVTLLVANILASPLRLGIAAGIIAFTFYSVALNLIGNGWVSSYRLARDGRPVVGTVVQLNPDQHHSCLIRYQVNGRQYISSQDGCDSVHGIGSAITLTYLPEEPAFSTSGSANSEFELLLLAPLGMSCLAGLLVGWRAWFAQKDESNAA